MPRRTASTASALMIGLALIAAISVLAVLLLILPYLGVTTWNELYKRMDWTSILLFGAGKIPKLFIDQVEFIAADIGMAKPRKGVTCQLTVRSGTEPLKLQLWMGGLLPGGLLYRFKAVDENFNA